MDDFQVIYRILRHLRKAMDFDEVDMAMVSHNALGITKQRWNKLLIQLYKNDYIENIRLQQWINEDEMHIIEPIEPSITLKGLEYLKENTMMKKAYNVAKGIKDLI